MDIRHADGVFGVNQLALLDDDAATGNSGLRNFNLDFLPRRFSVMVLL